MLVYTIPRFITLYIYLKYILLFILRLSMLVNDICILHNNVLFHKSIINFIAKTCHTISVLTFVSKRLNIYNLMYYCILI